MQNCQIQYNIISYDNASGRLRNIYITATEILSYTKWFINTRKG